MNTREYVLDKAKEYVLKDRQSTYDSPERNFDTIACLWDVYWASRDSKRPFSPHDVAVFMILVKVARLTKSPEHMDSWIDIAGYAACGAECAIPVYPIISQELIDDNVVGR